MEPPSEHCGELRGNHAFHRSLLLLSMGTARRRRRAPLRLLGWLDYIRNRSLISTRMRFQKCLSNSLNDLTC
jgi:hypothetical protein